MGRGRARLLRDYVKSIERGKLGLVAVEKRGKGSVRVRMKVIPDFKAKTIISFTRLILPI